jgi:shikimate kinase
MNIILCGLPMSGKSVVGALLAKQLTWDLVDIDKLIEKRYGKNISCREIYKLEGRESFREKEKEAVTSLKGSMERVIATGGGSFILEENKIALKSLGKVVYLRASPALVWQRILVNGIPPYLEQKNPKGSFLQMAKERMDVYEKVSEYSIDTEGMQEEEVMNTIIQEMLTWQAMPLAPFL